MSIVEAERYLVVIQVYDKHRHEILGCFSTQSEAEDFIDKWVDQKVDSNNSMRLHNFNLGYSCGPALTREDIIKEHNPVIEDRVIAIRIES